MRQKKSPPANNPKNALQIKGTKNAHTKKKSNYQSPILFSFFCEIQNYVKQTNKHGKFDYYNIAQD